ncbi:MAG: hypothetical protein V4720_06250 [Pseudomonadota bacterium]
MPPTQKELIAALQEESRGLREEVRGLKAEQVVFREQLAAADKLREDTHGMVSEMFGALMRPQIGHGNKSLVERMAEVTVDIESGKRTADNVLSIAKWLVGIAAALALITAFTKFGHIPKD